MKSASGQDLTHSSKEGTRPSDGAELTASPETSGMTFDMPVRVTLVSLTDQDGRDHALTRSDNLQYVKLFDAAPPTLPNATYKAGSCGLADGGRIG